MDRSILVILIIVTLSVIGSFPAAKISMKKERLYSATAGRIFHHIAVGAYISVAPAALLGSLLVGPLKLGIPLAMSGLGLSFVMLFFYALSERSARLDVDIEDHGWTQLDAESSGL